MVPICGYAILHLVQTYGFNYYWQRGIGTGLELLNWEELFSYYSRIYTEFRFQKQKRKHKTKQRSNLRLNVHVSNVSHCSVKGLDE